MVATEHHERIADLTLAMRAGDARLARSDAAPHGRFRLEPPSSGASGGASSEASGGAPAIRLKARVAARSLRLPRRAELLCDASTWRLYRAGASRWIEVDAGWPGAAGAQKHAVLDETYSRGTITVSPALFARAPRVDPLEYPLDELLVLLHLAQRQGEAGGLELHGCGLRDSDGTGYLFCGASGAGKSTLADLWLTLGDEGGKVLSDDRIILRVEGDEVWMHGTPWHGSSGHAAAERARLDRLFFISHGATSEARPLSLPLAVARVMSCCFVVFHQAEATRRTLALAERICRAVPASDLAFVPERAALELVRAELGSGEVRG